MKKIFYSVLVLAGFGFSIDSNAQCTPDASYTDIITNPVGSTVSGDTVWLPPVMGPGYSSVFYLNIPTSIDVSPTVTANVNWFKVVSLTGLPTGLDYQCSSNATDCKYNSGEIGCIEVYGDPVAPVTANTVYILDLQFQGNVSVSGNPITLNNAQLESAIGTYVFALKTGATVGVEELGFNSGVELFPNPANVSTTLKFSSKESKDLTISVVDIQGRVLNQNSIKTISGENTLDINTSDLSTGVYQVVLSNSKGHHSMKLVIE